MGSTETIGCTVDLIFFDFGGVLASEGFREGLNAIADGQGKERDTFFETALTLIHGMGYVTGETDEDSWWRALKFETGIQGTHEALRKEILSRFIIRGWMFDVVSKLKLHGVRLAILSDQTNWLDELNARHKFFPYFDYVINSFHYGRSKMDPDTFLEACRTVDVLPDRALHIDDTESHTWRAKDKGLKAIHYVDRESFMRHLRSFCGFIE